MECDLDELDEHEETLAMITRCSIHQSAAQEKSSVGESPLDVRLDTFPTVGPIAEGSVWTDSNSRWVYVFQHGIWRRSDQLCECCGVQLSSPVEVNGA